MGYGKAGIKNYRIFNGLAFTEDRLLVYNIFVLNLPKWTTEQQALDYFNKFGKVLMVRLVLDCKKKNNKYKIGFVNFADSKVAAKVLKKKKHILNNRKCKVRACHSWLQPDAQKAESLHVAGQKVDDIKSAEVKPDIETEQPSCSSSSSVDLEALILKLNDDCLEHICKNLDMPDQINFARSCQRFRDVFIMLSKVKYKTLILNNIDSLTLWQIRKFLKIAGPYIESLICKEPIKESEFFFKFLGSYCTNTKRVKIHSTKMNPKFLRELMGNMSLCTELELKNVMLGDRCIPIIKNLPNLKILKLEHNWTLTGNHISDLRGIEELSLCGSKFIQSVYFQQIFKNLTNLNTLDIRFCTELMSADFKQITKSLNNLENLKIGGSNTVPYECIAQLPKLKSLEIAGDMYRTQLFVDLAKYQSEQLEELLLMSDHSSLNLETASLVGELKKLKRLRCLCSASLDDKCLEKIAQLSELEYINLQYCTAFTNKGILNLLEHCHKLSSLNIICCNSLTDSFVFDALKLLKKQNVQLQRKGPVHMLAAYTNIHKFVAESSELKSSSHLMTINFQI